MIVSIETAMQFRQIFNAVLQLQNGSSDISTVLNDITSAMTKEELLVIKTYFDNSIINYSKNQAHAKQNNS